MTLTPAHRCMHQLNYVSNQGCASLQASNMESLQRIRNLHGDGDHQPHLSNITVAHQTLLFVRWQITNSSEMLTIIAAGRSYASRRTYPKLLPPVHAWTARMGACLLVHLLPQFPPKGRLYALRHDIFCGTRTRIDIQNTASEIQDVLVPAINCTVCVRLGSWYWRLRWGSCML